MLIIILDNDSLPNLFDKDTEEDKRIRLKEKAGEDLKEDQEAILEENNKSKDLNKSNNSAVNKKNGYMKKEESSPLGKDGVAKLMMEDETPSKAKTDRKDNPQHGTSGMPFDAGSLDSPKSSVKLKNKGSDANASHEKNNTEKSLNSKHDSKDDLGWNEDSKNNEDEKNDEERSLLYPDNDANIYKEDNKAEQNDDEMDDFRRPSTQPELPKNLTGQKEGEETKTSEDEEKVKELSECQKKSIAFIDSWQWGVFMTVVTIYTLFFDDIRVILIPKSADDVFFTITVICFMLFLFEIILSSVTKPGYWMSFFFWLDVMATFSMVFDIGWIMDEFNNASQADSAGSLAQSSRAARVTRIVRLVRLIRLVRIVKLYKQAKIAQEKREEAKLKKLREARGQVEEEEIKNQSIAKKRGLQRQKTITKDAGEVDIDEFQLESKISKTLSEKNQKILIILILSTLFGTPMFQRNTYIQPVPAPEFGLDQLMEIYGNYSVSTGYAEVYNQSYNQFVSRMVDYEYPLIELEVPVHGQTKHNDPKGDLRSDEFTVITSKNDSKATYSMKEFNQYEAMINIGRTIMVCFLLLVSSYIINRDATRLVLEPIERMVERVRIVAKNPMALCSEEEIENEGALALVRSQQKKKKVTEEDHKNETAFLEASLFTIGRLLGLCFGEAGARIIGNNIASSEIGNDFNPVIPGSKEMAIFGFCDIRGFADATEALEEDVMRFVNQIADTVHSECDLHQGSSNKNLGEAFLMVWKYPREDILSFDEILSPSPDSKYSNSLGDLAVLGFLKANAGVNKFKHLLEYNKNEKMLERIPNYRINMGFGLHVGWGIEGAIGSPYKIDASYLSPNVNISARLEAATRQYGVSILISGELHDVLSEPFQKITRLLDIVTVKGSENPMKFFTVDLKLD